MFRHRTSIAVATILAALSCATAAAQEAAPELENVYPLAIFPFQERGKEVAEMGGKVTDLLFANLAANPQMFLVEREDLKKVGEELEIGRSGIVDPKSAARIGQLTGAQVLVTGSVFQVGDRTHVVAKIIGTETSRVVGAWAKGKVSDELDPLIEQLAKEVVAKVQKNGKVLVAKPVTHEDRVAALSTAIGPGSARPAVYIDITERHIGQAAPDAAAETEVTRFFTELGFKVIDRHMGDKSEADIAIVGEGFSQFAARHGNLVSVKARLELKAVDRKSGRILAADKQTAIAVDLAELVASKASLEDAAGKLLARLLPAMVKKLPPPAAVPPAAVPPAAAQPATTTTPAAPSGK